MALDFLVTISDKPLEFDTLPALKARYSRHGEGLCARNVATVYTLARLYLLDGRLQLALTAFERSPLPESRISFALGGQGEYFVLATVSPTDSVAALCGKDAPPAPWDFTPAQNAVSLPVDRYAGIDEQGWYWGVKTALPTELTEKAGCVFKPGARFFGTLLKYRQNRADFSSSSPLGQSAGPLDFEHFGAFRIVDF